MTVIIYECKTFWEYYYKITWAYLRLKNYLKKLEIRKRPRTNGIEWPKVGHTSWKAAKVLIRNSFRYFYVDLVRLLQVMPHLEFVVPVWNPCMKKYIEKLENIQHRATRLAPNLRKNSYE